jgi:hypothetical protein
VAIFATCAFFGICLRAAEASDADILLSFQRHVSIVLFEAIFNRRSGFPRNFFRCCQFNDFFAFCSKLSRQIYPSWDASNVANLCSWKDVACDNSSRVIGLDITMYVGEMPFKFHAEIYTNIARIFNRKFAEAKESWVTEATC